MMTRGALEGLKVLDISVVLAGPITTKILAEYGAQVIKVESAKRPDLSRFSTPYKEGIAGVDRSAYFALINPDKQSLAVDLTQVRGVELVKKLVAGWADVVVENYAPGVVKKLGLDYEELRKLKPDIIMVSCGILGQRAGYSGWGPAAAAISGYYYVTGWPDREPTVGGIYGPGDMIIARFAVCAILGALVHKRRTGMGQYLDIAQVECLLKFLGPAVLDYLVNGRRPMRMGNRVPEAAPHGAFRCKGDDKWCIISVFTEDEWRAFCAAIGNPSLSRDVRFATLALRKENEDELEKLVEEWTANYSPEEVMVTMQEKGVPAGVVQTNEDLLNHDAQLKARRFFQLLEHPVIGPLKQWREPFVLSNTPGRLERHAPLMGEHNYHICVDILGLSDREFEQLAEDGVLE